MRGWPQLFKRAVRQVPCIPHHTFDKIAEGSDDKPDDVDTAHDTIRIKVGDGSTEVHRDRALTFSRPHYGPSNSPVPRAHDEKSYVESCRGAVLLFWMTHNENIRCSHE